MFLKLLNMVIDAFQVYHHFKLLFIVFFQCDSNFWTLFLDCFSGLYKIYKKHPNRQLKPTLKGSLVQCFIGTWNMRFCYAQWAASVGSAGCRKVAVLSILIILWIDIRITVTDGSWQCLKMCGCMSDLGRAWSHWNLKLIEKDPANQDKDS